MALCSSSPVDLSLIGKNSVGISALCGLCLGWRVSSLSEGLPDSLVLISTNSPLLLPGMGLSFLTRMPLPCRNLDRPLVMPTWDDCLLSGRHWRPTAGPPPELLLTSRKFVLTLKPTFQPPLEVQRGHGFAWGTLGRSFSILLDGRKFSGN